MSSPTQYSPGYPAPYPPRQKSWIERHWIALVISIVLFFVLAVVVFVVGIFVLVSNTEPEKLAFAKAANSPAVVERLGQPIKKGMFSSGSINTTGPSGHAELKVPISGPKGEGYIYLTANKSADRWTFTQLEVAIDGDEKRIELVEPTRVPEQNSF
ncbi:conserved hypothetical protein [Candidatus Koribacter versatilis Ellin345]|uniref:Cytochrome oxidase complex assembly protein 1 n=1 Tax=Koribacter versatilis (strain Ellin345) TaxID=204669 RepID=Q1IH80_KORVE|nr:cytochrome c oxidase assembly factor Coa1 family protein [Candidatus Koribacter versatilis]ABF43770.1 conserved hypothetical protein [Candidatus Koribacter versatilis Ellin345]